MHAKKTTMDTFLQTKLLIVLWPFFVHTAGPLVGTKDLRACAIIPGIVIVTDSMAAQDSVLMNHEKIHFAQAKELWYIGYFFVYTKEFITNRIIRKLSGQNSYYANSLEYEAYVNQWNSDYLKTRKKNAWKQYVTSKKKKILYKNRQLYEVRNNTDTTRFSMIATE